MDWEKIYSVAALLVVLPPVASLLVIGLTTFLRRPLSEKNTALLASGTVWVGLLATITVTALFIARGSTQKIINFGEWYSLHEEHFHFELELIFDRLSIPFVLLSYVLCGTILAFASKYLHREPGFHRFFLLFSMFLSGIVIAALAGTIELMFAGWEMVGLSSAMLVAYFQDRQAPVRNGLRVWSVYRIADAAFLIGAVALHHLTSEGEFSVLLGTEAWPNGQAAISGSSALLVGGFLLVAAMGKSALVPFSGWLPRAMEGPTPSSAIFYGALSVHLGVFLLLRISPLLEQSSLLCAVIVVVGLSTAFLAALASRVQADIKSSLAFASLAQVGLMVAEVGFGFRYLVLVHMIGHACIRTLQLVRAPTLLHDYHTLENAVGGHLRRHKHHTTSTSPFNLERHLYRWALERGYLDIWLDRFVVAPFARLFRRLDSLEKRWTDWMAGKRSRESEFVGPSSSFVED